jgi:hypothetical protein
MKTTPDVVRVGEKVVIHSDRTTEPDEVTLVLPYKTSPMTKSFLTMSHGVWTRRNNGRFYPKGVARGGSGNPDGVFITFGE